MTNPETGFELLDDGQLIHNGADLAAEAVNGPYGDAQAQPDFGEELTRRGISAVRYGENAPEEQGE